MNITQHPDLLDRLAASYALGTLRGGARRRFEALAREHATVRAAALVWQTRWSGLTELQPAIDPAPAVWTRIDNLVRAGQLEQAMRAARQAAPAQAPGGWWRNLLVWRGAAAAGAIATLAAVVVGVQVNGGLRAPTGAQIAALQQQLQAPPQIQYVAVLADDKADASMLVTFDPKNNQLVLQRVGVFQEGADKSLQLWALPPAGVGRSRFDFCQHERSEAAISSAGDRLPMQFETHAFGFGSIDFLGNRRHIIAAAAIDQPD